ncbi:MAG: LTA synthase family protein [Clostridia bacterium]|nr:LTA synthase family protein [Clostridia bacterium]
MKKKFKKKSLPLYILLAFLLILCITISVVCTYVGNEYAFGLRQILYTLNGPLEGADTGMVPNGMKACLPIIIPLAIIIIALFVLDYRKRPKMCVRGKIFKWNCNFDLMKGIRKFTGFLVVAGLIGSVILVENTFEITAYIESLNQISKIYEEEYVDPETVKITAPAEKKNLILIYMESMETSYQSVEDGGLQKTNYMPNLTAMAKEHISFSDDEKIGGFRSLEGTEWTAAALLSTSSGVPFSFPVQQNSMDKYEKYAPGLVMLGDILEDEGYTQEFLCGSKAEFGGRKKMFMQHGNYRIFDLFTAREAGYLPSPDYHDHFWGYEDMYLYKIAKDEITKLYEEGNPFNFTMLTVDTHFPDGHPCPLCENKHDTIAANVVECADRQIAEFIAWCKQQPFYEDTVIIISGDHPRMDKVLVENEPDFLERTIYNCFINAQVEGSINMKNRDFTSMDMFPTILASLGYQIEGNRLGLGTNLFSQRETLAEEMGVLELQKQLNMQSDYYMSHFMFERNCGKTRKNP